MRRKGSRRVKVTGPLSHVFLLRRDLGTFDQDCTLFLLIINGVCLRVHRQSKLRHGYWRGNTKMVGARRIFFSSVFSLTMDLLEASVAILALRKSNVQIRGKPRFVLVFL
uniref:Uncharacterized protein n=1 Tax=Rhipicephalus microplus TaxID=6941 RepID=A0A6G5AIY2_RHIMP